MPAPDSGQNLIVTEVEKQNTAHQPLGLHTGVHPRGGPGGRVLPLGPKKTLDFQCSFR